MELRRLRYFVAVAEERHYGRAADRLHIAQPPLSQQIKRLEGEVGATLLRRTTRRVELTPAGALLLERARDIIAAADLAVADCLRAAEGEIGHLSIGFTGSITYALLPAVAAALRAALPGVTLELHGEQLTPVQVQGLLAGTLDLGLLRPPVRAPELKVEVVRSEPLIAAIPESHALAGKETVDIADLMDEPFVTYSAQVRSVLGDFVSDVCAQHGFTPRSVIEITETATLVSFVAAGIGVALVPASVTGMTVAGATYRPLVQDVRVQMAVAWHRDNDSAVLQRALKPVLSAVMSRPSDAFISDASRL